MAISFFYHIPNSYLLTIFIIIFSVLSLLGLYFFMFITQNVCIDFFNDMNTSLYISIISIILGLILAFIITNEWQSYTQIEDDIEVEVNALFLMYKTVEALPDNNEIKLLINKYICSIINVEFPAMQNGDTSFNNSYIDNLVSEIYKYVPVNSKNEILYNKTIDLLNESTYLRNKRLVETVSSIPNELWWVLIIGYIVLITLMLFVTGHIMYRILMTTFITIVYASAFFLIVALDYPFMGDFGIKPTPFENLLKRISPNYVCN
jgi:hypothetical protein